MDETAYFWLTTVHCASLHFYPADGRKKSNNHTH